jgi:hypothetical protein
MKSSVPDLIIFTITSGEVKIISKPTFRWQEEFRLGGGQKNSDGVQILAVPERANI